MQELFDAPSIDGFCARQGISRGSYYNLRKAGKGPQEFRVGTRVVITREAERQWREARQAAAEAERLAAAEKRAARRAEEAAARQAAPESPDVPRAPRRRQRVSS